MNNLLFLTKKKALNEFPCGWRDRFTGTPQRSFQEGRDSQHSRAGGLGGQGRFSRPEMPEIQAVSSGLGSGTAPNPAGSPSGLLRSSVSCARSPRRLARPPGPEQDARQRPAGQPGPQDSGTMKSHFVPQAMRGPAPARGIRICSQDCAHGGAGVPAGLDLRVLAAESRQRAAWRPRAPVSDARFLVLRSRRLHLYCENLHRLAPGWH